MKLIDDNGIEYILTLTLDPTFIIEQRKTDIFTLTPYKDKWNDPNSDFIERVYKSIKIGNEHYSYEPLKK